MQLWYTYLVCYVYSKSMLSVSCNVKCFVYDRYRHLFGIVLVLESNSIVLLLHLLVARLLVPDLFCAVMTTHEELSGHQEQTGNQACGAVHGLFLCKFDQVEHSKEMILCSQKNHTR